MYLLITTFVVSFFSSFISANSIEFHDNILTYFWDDIQSTYSEINFSYGSNSNVGIMFWLEPVTITWWTTITMGNSSKTCTKQIRGFYYSNIRWEKLWPLDNTTLTTLKLASTEYNNLTVSNGLYMWCTGENPTNVYGQVKWTYDSYSTTLNAGIRYNFTENDPIRVFAPSLQFFEGIRVASGYLFDTVAWVGKLQDIDLLSDSCSFNNGYVANGQSITAYQAETVPSWNTCQSETRTCVNGVLNGTYEYSECTIGGTNYRPDAFYFTKINNAELDTIYTSEWIVISGLSPNATTTGRLSAGRWSISDTFSTSRTGYFKNGDIIKIELTSASTNNTMNYANVDIGWYSTKFYIKTKALTWETEETRNDNIISVFIRFINTFKYNSGSTLVSLFQQAQNTIANNLDIVDTSSATGEIASFKTLLELAIAWFSWVNYTTWYEAHAAANGNAQQGTVFSWNKHITPNCKDYSIKYDENKQWWYSPYMKQKMYFINDLALRKYLDAMNPGDCTMNVYIDSNDYSDAESVDENKYIAPNGRLFTIKQYALWYTSMEFIIVKYFTTEKEIKNHIDVNNPVSKIWQHTIASWAVATEYKAPNGKIYKIYNTDKWYMSYQLSKVQYFSTLERLQQYIADRNKK